MKKKSPPYAIIGAAILGLLAVFLYFQHEKTVAAENQAKIDAANKAAQDAINAANAHQPAPVLTTNTDMRPVLYATQPVDPGVKLSPAFYEKKPTPNDILPDAFTDQTDITGWVAIRRIEKGDPLTPRNIGRSLPYLSQRIGLGMREITLPVFSGDINNTGGYIVDGDRVDLLYTTTAGDNAVKTEVVMQNLNILSVPGSPIKTDKSDGVNPNPGGGGVAVSFEVTPEQAEILVFMSQAKTGRFNMILRSRRDPTQIKYKAVTADDYAGNLSKIQRTTDASVIRVQELAAKIEAQEKLNQGQGNTNETPTPTPPSP